jgi:DUF971 family protein
MAGVFPECDFMDSYPTSIERGGDRQLLVEWSDGRRLRYSAKVLRDACPCATCREQRKAPSAPPNPLAIISAQEARPMDVAGMKPVGDYAYSVAFSDGHDTGIFTFELLREIGEPA